MDEERGTEREEDTERQACPSSNRTTPTFRTRATEKREKRKIEMEDLKKREEAKLKEMSTFKARPSPRRPRKADQSQLFGSKVFESPRTRRVRGQASGRQARTRGFRDEEEGGEEGGEDLEDSYYRRERGREGERERERERGRERERERGREKERDRGRERERERDYGFDGTDKVSADNDYGIHTPEHGNEGERERERDERERGYDDDVGFVDSLVSDMTVNADGERVAVVADAVSDMIIDVIKMQEEEEEVAEKEKEQSE